MISPPVSRVSISAELCGNLLRSRGALAHPGHKGGCHPGRPHNTIGLMADADRPDVPSGLASSLVLSEFGLQYAIDRE